VSLFPSTAPGKDADFAVFSNMHCKAVPLVPNTGLKNGETRDKS